MKSFGTNRAGDKGAIREDDAVAKTRAALSVTSSASWAPTGVRGALTFALRSGRGGSRGRVREARRL